MADRTPHILPAPSESGIGNPWPGWLLLVSGLILFSPLLEGGTTHLAVMLVRLLILLLLAAFLLEGLKVGVVSWPSLTISFPVLAYLGLAIISVARSPYTHQSFQWLIVLLSYAAVFYLLVSFIKQWDHVEKLLAIQVAMGLFEAGWAFVQAGWLGSSRPSGTFFNPNFLAGYLAVIWVLVLAFVCYLRVGSRGRSGTNRRQAFLFAGSIVLLILLLAAMVMSGSRGGMVAALVGTAVVIGLRFGRKGVGLVVLLVLLGLAAPSPLRDRVLAEHVANPVTYARLQIWQSSVLAMADHPLGIGIGLYQYVYPSYALAVEGEITRYGKVAQTAHNEYLQMGVELGVASLLIFCWGGVLVAWEARSALQQRLKRWQRGVLVGLVAAVAGVLVHAAMDSNLHEPALAILLILCVGVLLSVRRLSGYAREPWRAIPLRSRAIWASLGILLIGGLAMAVIRMGLAWTFFEAGSQALAKQDFPKAVTEYQTAISLDPGKALYHSSMAAAHFKVFERTRDMQAAQATTEDLRLATALNPLDGRLAGLLGHVYTSLAQTGPASGSPGEQRDLWLQASVAYERAVELEPFTPFYRVELGKLFLLLGDREKAEATVRRSVEIEPNFLPGREWLAKFYLEGGRLDAVDREYREILERQQRYAHWAKDPLEERFLRADGPALAAALERKRRSA